MKIWEILKEENVGKEYEFIIENYSYIVNIVKEGGIVKCMYKDKPIESIFNLYYLLNYDFEKCVDWSKVPVDTKILVSCDGEEWSRRHFAKYENGRVYAWDNGRTSFSIDANYDDVYWDYAKLYEE